MNESILEALQRVFNCASMPKEGEFPPYKMQLMWIILHGAYTVSNLLWTTAR